MAEAAKHALELEAFNVVADAGYSNGEQVVHCEAVGITPYVPVMRTINNQGDGTLFGRTDFRYERGKRYVYLSRRQEAATQTY